MSNLRSSDDDADFGAMDTPARAARFEKVVTKGGKPPLPPPPEHIAQAKPDPRTVAFAEKTSAVVPRCPLCGTAMSPGKGSVSNGTVGMGCVGMLLGLVLCVVLFPIGAVVGLPIIIGSAILGSIRQRGLRCSNRRCRHFIPRQ